MLIFLGEETHISCFLSFVKGSTLSGSSIIFSLKGELVVRDYVSQGSIEG